MFVDCVGAVQNNSRHEDEPRSSAERKPKRCGNERLCNISISASCISETSSLDVVSRYPRIRDKDTLVVRLRWQAVLLHGQDKQGDECQGLVSYGHACPARKAQQSS